MKRAYATVETMDVSTGHGITLDGKPLKTPGRRDLLSPSAALAREIAAEWREQAADIRPATMPLTRLTATAIDHVAVNRAQIVSDVAAYAATDLVCYRAGQPRALAARQHAVWQPLLDWAAAQYDAPLAITIGVVPREQSPASLRAFAAAVAAQDDFRLTALQGATAASGSLVIGLGMLERHLGAAAAFAAAELDESFQNEAWGLDAEAEQRRHALAADLASIARFLELLRANC